MQFLTNSKSKQLTADRPRWQVKTKRARCEIAAIRKKKFGLLAVSLKKKKSYLTLSNCISLGRNRSLTCKLLKLFPDTHIVRTIMELIQNRSCSKAGKQNRLRRL